MSPILPPDSLKSPEEVQKIVAKGGRHWSAPGKATLGKTEFTEPGPHFYLWPTEDRVYEATKFGDSYNARITLNWVLRTDEGLRKEPTPSFICNLADTDGVVRSWSLTREVRLDDKTGTFFVDLPDPYKTLKGEHEIIFVLTTNRRVNIPIGNFVKVKVKFPE